MDIEIIRLVKRQLWDIGTDPQLYQKVVIPNVVMQIKEDILLIAHEFSVQYPYISFRLQGLRDGLFPLIPVGYSVNLSTLGQIIELLDFLLHEAENPEQNIWHLIHPRIVNSSQKLFLSGNYANAATDAFIEINERVKNLFKIVSINTPVPDGTSLMTTVFTPKKPLIKLCDISDKTGEDKQTGLMNMLQGAISALRNPKSHANSEAITQEEAMRRLMFASTLMYQIDEAVAYSKIVE